MILKTNQKEISSKTFTLLETIQHLTTFQRKDMIVKLVEEQNESLSFTQNKVVLKV